MLIDYLSKVILEDNKKYYFRVQHYREDKKYYAVIGNFWFDEADMWELYDQIENYDEKYAPYAWELFKGIYMTIKDKEYESVSKND